MYDSSNYAPNNVNCSSSSCAPIQVITLNEPIKSLSDVIIYSEGDNRAGDAESNGCVVNSEELKWSHSLDSACWSCWSDWDTELASTMSLSTDFFVKFQIQGNVSSISISDETGSNYTKTYNYSSSILSGFNFTQCSATSVSSNQYNPYANMECAIALQQQLSETVACLFGIPIYYFKVSGVKDSADITFKEYALKHVTSVKQIKMVIKDGQMPSSKPEFADFGLDWQTDWEVEITKGMFATAFGTTEQPTEGDMVYVPMMKRMWQVNEAYDEKNDSLMWVSTTFKLALVKYQDDTMIDKTGVEDVVNSIVKNKYEDLFGDEEDLDSGVEASEPVEARPDNMIPVFESDACRKYISVKETEIKSANQSSDPETVSLYYKGTLISDSYYDFTSDSNNKIRIEYQRQYCGDELSLSFILKFDTNNIVHSDGTILQIGNIKVKYKFNVADKSTFSLYIINNKKLEVTLEPSKWYLITLRSSKSLGTMDFGCYEYTHPSAIPTYKLRKFHFYIDIDNGQTKTSSWTSEMDVDEKNPIYVYGFDGYITNIKVINTYISDLSELMMQYPTNQHTLVNDTVRPIFGLLGVKMF